MRNGSYEISKFAVPEIPKVYMGRKLIFQVVMLFSSGIYCAPNWLRLENIPQHQS
jgi:hypothetical protein